MKAKIITKIPGTKSEKVIHTVRKLNGGWGVSYPFVHSKDGSGCYFKDIDENTFLDFASQIASNPLGYNHPDIKAVIKQYSSRAPVKFAGQDFLVKEHALLLEELLSITPRHLNAAFFVNSGAEAVENCLKISMRNRKKAKVGISFESAFHGRTLGALSCTNSKTIQKKNFFSIPMKRLPFDESAGDVLQQMLKHDVAPEGVAFIILEHLQGEGGYRVPSKKMVKDIRVIAKQHNIPYIADEVQAGMGRTGEWWAFQHFKIQPDTFSSAKALGIGATIANKKFFPKEPGSICSTWGGGQIIDLAVGVQTIKTLKRKRILSNVQRMGVFLEKELQALSAICPQVSNIRGLGLMRAFDLPSKKAREDVIIGALKNGLVLLGCGDKGVRLVPPLIIKREEIIEAIDILEKTIKECCKPKFKHTGKICQYTACSEDGT